MSASPLTYCLTHVFANIPEEVLFETFRPDLYHTTIDQRILQEVVYKRVIHDTNLVAGKLKQIELLSDYQVNTTYPDYAQILGSANDAVFYFIPPEAREHRNINAVVQLTNAYSFMGVNGSVGTIGSMNTTGNTVEGLAGAALSSYTGYGTPIMPAPYRQSSNLIRIDPQTYTDGLILWCTLDYDREFTNMNQNVIFSLRELVLSAVKTYIYNTMRIKIDTNEVRAGVPIGSLKEVILSYEGEASTYEEKLFDVRGAEVMTPEWYGRVLALAL